MVRGFVRRLLIFIAVAVGAAVAGISIALIAVSIPAVTENAVALLGFVENAAHHRFVLGLDVLNGTVDDLHVAEILLDDQNGSIHVFAKSGRVGNYMGRRRVEQDIVKPFFHGGHKGMHRIRVQQLCRIVHARAAGHQGNAELLAAADDVVHLAFST